MNAGVVRMFFAGLLVLAAAAAVPALAYAAGTDQPQDAREQVRRRVLERVERYLDEQFRELREEIRRILDEELARRFPEGQPEHARRQDRPPERARPRQDAPARPRRPGYLGIYPQDEDGAVTIEEVLPGTPAERAGLQPGDVILSVNGREVESVEDLRARLARAGAGAEVTLRIARRYEERDVRVRLGAYPEESEHTPGVEEEEEESGGAEQPQGGEQTLRERIRRWIERRRGEREQPGRAAPQREGPEHQPAPGEDPDRLLDRLLSEEGVQQMLDRAEEALREMGVDLTMWLERDQSGRWRLTEEAREYLRGIIEGEGVEAFRRRFDEMRERLQQLLEQFGEAEPRQQAQPQESRPPREEAPPAGRGGYLGVAVSDPGSEVRARFDLESDVGLLVSRVTAGSPAERAGIRSGDILLRLDGEWIRGERDLTRRLARMGPGRRVRITLIRDGEEQTVEAQLGEKP